MREIQDLTSGEELGRQWRRLLRRRPVPSGKRQEDFLPIETVLCAAAALLVNHRRYGGANAHLAEQPVPQLAALFRRPNTSILAKMANVDGSRPHGAKWDTAVATELLGRLDRLAEVYSGVLAEGRRQGVAPEVLPDFLELETDGRIDLMGQEEIESALEAAVDSRVADWGDAPDPLTVRFAEVGLRVGQHRFARDVLANYGHRCAFCGFHLPAEQRRRLLRASHIKPWAACSGRERLDVSNGVAACPTHDAAFDIGFLTINGGLRIHVAPKVRSLMQSDEGPLGHAFGKPPLAEELLLPAGGTPPGRRYLSYHRDFVWAA